MLRWGLFRFRPLLQVSNTCPRTTLCFLLCDNGKCLTHARTSTASPPPCCNVQAWVPLESFRLQLPLLQPSRCVSRWCLLGGAAQQPTWPGAAPPSLCCRKFLPIGLSTDQKAVMIAHCALLTGRNVPDTSCTAQLAFPRNFLFTCTALTLLLHECENKN